MLGSNQRGRHAGDTDRGGRSAQFVAIREAAAHTLAFVDAQAQGKTFGQVGCGGFEVFERVGQGPVRSVRQSLGAYAIRFYHYRALSAEKRVEVRRYLLCLDDTAKKGRGMSAMSISP